LQELRQVIAARRKADFERQLAALYTFEQHEGWKPAWATAKAAWRTAIPSQLATPCALPSVGAELLNKLGSRQNIIGGVMKIRDLSPEQLEELSGVCAAAELKCNGILDIEIEDLPLFIEAAVEDRDAHIERMRKWCDLMDEFDSLIDPIRAQYPDLEHEKLIWLLHGTDQVRAYAIHRELLEMITPPLVKRDRQKWHDAVENEILDQLPGRSTSVNQIVGAMLSRDPAHPPEPVRRYVEYLLEIPILMGRLETSL
jgi:hypothetical protein